MTVYVNGEARECKEGTTLDQLIEALDRVAERVATMLNNDVISRAERSERVLQDGDRVEVLSFAGGG